MPTPFRSTTQMGKDCGDGDKDGDGSDTSSRVGVGSALVWCGLRVVSGSDE